MQQTNETNIYGLLKKLKANINLMGFDYDRMSSSGQELYDEILQTIKKIDKLKEVL